ncbi:MAG: hypothetical protein JF628_08965 [Sphingomonas sp.]|nr:hypothetical protein [Sphingomonas sp.]
MDITDSDKSNNDVLITACFCYIALPKSLYPEDSGMPRRYGADRAWRDRMRRPAVAAVGIKSLIITAILVGSRSFPMVLAGKRILGAGRQRPAWIAPWGSHPTPFVLSEVEGRCAMCLDPDGRSNFTPWAERGCVRYWVVSGMAALELRCPLADIPCGSIAPGSVRYSQPMFAPARVAQA